MKPVAVLIEATVYDPATSSDKVVRVCNRNDPRVCTYNGQEWRPILMKSPAVGLSVFNGDFSGFGTTTIDQFVIAATELDLDVIASYVWHGSTIKIYAGDPSVTPVSFPLIFTAVGDGLVRKSNESLTISLSTNNALTDKQLLYLSYAGTNDIEGTVDMKGVLKPMVFGDAKYCKPVLIDPVRQIYQVHGYGPVESIYGCFEGGQPIGTAGNPYASYSLGGGHTYATFRDAVLPQGEWIRFNDLGLVKLGSQPTFPVTVHVKGDNNNVAGAAALVKAADIVKRMVTSTVTGVSVSNSSLVALNTASPQAIDLYFEDQITVLEAIAMTLVSIGGYWFWDATGTMAFGRVRFGASTMTLSANNDRLPDVMNISQLATSAPVWSLRLGAAACHFVHDASSVPSALLDLQDQIETFKNPRFDTDTLYWKLTAGMSRVAGTGAEPPYVQATVNNDNLLSDIRPVPPGALRLYISYDAKRNTAGTQIANDIQFYDATGGLIASGSGGQPRINDFGAPAAGIVILQNNVPVQSVPINQWATTVLEYTVPQFAVSYVYGQTFVLAGGQVDKVTNFRSSTTVPGADQTSLDPVVSSTSRAATSSDNLVANPTFTELDDAGGVRFWKNIGGTFAYQTYSTAGDPAKWVHGNGVAMQANTSSENAATGNGVIQFQQTPALLFMSALVRGVGGWGQARVFVELYKAGAFVVQLATDLGDSTNGGVWKAYSKTLDVSIYSFDSIRIYVQGLNQAGTDIDFTALRVAPTELSASVDANIVVDTPALIMADATGTPKTGEFNKVITAKLRRAGVDLTADVTWAATLLTGNVTFSISGTGTATLTLTGPNSSSLALESSIRLTATYHGTEHTETVKVQRVDDPPTSGGGGGGGNPGTTQSTTTLNNTNGTSYIAGAESAILSVVAGTAGQVACTAPITMKRSPGTSDGTTGAKAKWQWRVPAGTWADITTEVSSSSNAITETNPGDPTLNIAGNISCSMTKTGLTTGNTYEFKLLWRRVDVDGNNNDVRRTAGTLQAAGS